jgi:hypothetical protein
LGALAIQYIRKAISVNVVFSDDADMSEHYKFGNGGRVGGLVRDVVTPQEGIFM